MMCSGICIYVYFCLVLSKAHVFFIYFFYLCGWFLVIQQYFQSFAVLPHTKYFFMVFSRNFGCLDGKTLARRFLIDGALWTK